MSECSLLSGTFGGPLSCETSVGGLHPGILVPNIGTEADMWWLGHQERDTATGARYPASGKKAINLARVSIDARTCHILEDPDRNGIQKGMSGNSRCVRMQQYVSETG